MTAGALTETMLNKDTTGLPVPPGMIISGRVEDQP